ncbi:unnamed protein product [Symbiodinium necroappetens]|uniref:Uncharacterized protein n=1 Tax=Symbiodinium necroappetens TaxID=1628268 RepID=A0A813BQ11_9DINO|nr:unnamed protein product [Symbiodinium necroappetens]
MGTAPDSGTLARLLLQRTNISMYGPEARRQQQQQQQYQQMGVLYARTAQAERFAVPDHMIAECPTLEYPSSRVSQKGSLDRRLTLLGGFWNKSPSNGSWLARAESQVVGM